MTELIEFHGMQIEATCQEGVPYANLRRLCEFLRMSYPRQLTKLREAHWAVVAMMGTTGSDGKNYDMAFVSADTIPMWLAGINAKKVAEDVRPQLKVIQQEMRDVLYKHFCGESDLTVYGKIGDMVAAGMQRGFDKYFGPIQTDVGVLKEDMTVVKKDVAYLKSCEKQKRKDFSKAAIRAAMAAIEELYNGRCPCCDQKCLHFEAHHWRGKGGRDCRVLFMLSPACHRKAEEGGSEWHDSKESRFSLFQERCKPYFVSAGCMSTSRRWETQRRLF